MNPPTRRRVLGAGGLGVLAVGTGTSFVAATPGLHPDARLFELVAQYIETDRRVDAINEPFYDTPMSQIPAWVDEQSEHLVDGLHRMHREIGSIPARTRDGLAAKARAALAHASITDDEDLDEGSDAFVAHSLCRDLLRGIA